MKWFCAIALVMTLLASPAGAQENAPPPQRPGGPDGPRPPFGPPWAGRDWRFRRGPTEEEWSETAQFMKEHSPKRWEAFTRLPEEQQGRLRPLAFQRYRLLNFQKDNEPEFYDIGVKRWETEDRIFALTHELRKADSAHEQEIRQKLRAALGKMFDLRVQERQIRISRLQRQINTENEQMAREKQDREQIISQRMELAEKEHGRLGDEDSDATTQPSDATTAPQGAD